MALPQSISTLRDTPSEIERKDPRVEKIIDRAEANFKAGLLNLKKNKADKARDDFDKAVDTILESGIDVRSNPVLNRYYIELVQRIYLIEAPAGPSTKSQSNILLATPAAQTAPAVGLLKEQKFEPSNLDVLSKLVLESEEVRPLSMSKRPVRCTVAAASKVELRGFRLGMSINSVRQRIPGLSVTSASRFGLTKANLTPQRGKTRNSTSPLKGVAAASFEFLDGRMTALSMLYDDSINWNNSDEFISQISRALKLPVSWRSFDGYASYRYGDLKHLQCDEYLFIAGLAPVSYKRLPFIHWSDLEAAQKLRARVEAEAERRRRLEEERRKAFKP